MKTPLGSAGSAAVLGIAIHAALLPALVLPAQAGPVGEPAALLQPAGPPPSEEALKVAISAHLNGRPGLADARHPFKILSGPTLATGNTFGGGVEQAWLVCLLVNAPQRAPGPTDLDGLSLYLRQDASGQLAVVPTTNWEESSPKCGTPS